MSFRTLFVLLFLALLAVFAGLNWPAFTAPAELNLLITRIHAPLGLVMLGVVVFLTLVYALFVVGVEASALIEVRRYARELHQVRKKLDKEEESRFAQLKGFLETELAGLKGEHSRIEKTLLEALDRTEGQLTEALKSEAEALAQRVETAKLLLNELKSRLEAVAPKLRAEVKEELEKAVNTLSAYIGELEDRLEKSHPEA